MATRQALAEPELWQDHPWGATGAIREYPTLPPSVEGARLFSVPEEHEPASASRGSEIALRSNSDSASGWLWQSWQERASVRVAIIAEVMALSQIAEQRSYQTNLFEMAKALRAIPEEQRPQASLKVRVPEHYCRVYLANLCKLGYLAPGEAQLVVSFYQYIDSVVQDVTAGGLLHEGTSDPEAFAEAANVIQFAMNAAQKLAAKHCRAGR